MSPQKSYFLKNMICTCCVAYLKEKLENAGLLVTDIQLGQVSLINNCEETDTKARKIFKELGFEVIQNRDLILIEKIKIAVIELIHYLNNTNSIIRKSDYLVEKLGMSYQHISKTFSQHETITLERYIILQKIEKIKELLDASDYSLSEISYLMDYSSVQHLSSQFKQITGLTPSEYKHSDRSMRKPIDKLY